MESNMKKYAYICNGFGPNQVEQDMDRTQIRINYFTKVTGFIIFPAITD